MFLQKKINVNIYVKQNLFHVNKKQNTVILIKKNMAIQILIYILYVTFLLLVVKSSVQFDLMIKYL